MPAETDRPEANGDELWDRLHQRRSTQLTSEDLDGAGGAAFNTSASV